MKALVRVAQWALPWNVSVSYRKFKSNIRNYLFLIFEIGTSVKDCNTKALRNVKSICHMWRSRELSSFHPQCWNKDEPLSQRSARCISKTKSLGHMIKKSHTYYFCTTEAFSLAIHRLCSYSALVVVGCCFSKTVVPVEKTSCLLQIILT